MGTKICIVLSDRVLLFIQLVAWLISYRNKKILSDTFWVFELSASYLESKVVWFYHYFAGIITGTSFNLTKQCFLACVVFAAFYKQTNQNFYTDTIELTTYQMNLIIHIKNKRARTLLNQLAIY